MFKKAVFPGKYIQGSGAVTELPALINLLGSQGLILSSPSVADKVLPQCALNPRAEGIFTDRFQGECCEDEISRISGIVAEKQVDVLVGMGGGKTIDTAKIAADRAGIPVVIIPTIASSDAPCSGCAVLYTKDGIFDRVYYQKSNPAAVLVDVDIIAAAPARFLVAGMGDALATWFEARSCKRTQSRNECGGYSTIAGQHIARLCFETLLTYGETARLANEKQIVTPALEHIVEANILLSGLGFESAGLGAAHAIHNGLTALAQTHAYFHGEKVAFGVLAGLQLTDADPEESGTVFSFCEAVGLPTTLADIGIGDIGKGALMKVAELACAPDQPMSHEPGVIHAQNVLDAMLAADAMGRTRKDRS